MPKSPRPLALALILAPAAAMAQCPGEVIFSCPIGTKVLDLCLTDTNLTYSFGRPGKPDLTITEMLENLAYQPWPGIGRTIWESVRFHNEDVDYDVWAAIDKPMSEADNPEWAGGVIVTRGDETLADLTCDLPPEPPFLDVLYDAKANLGQCWDFDAQVWGACGGE